MVNPDTWGDSGPLNPAEPLTWDDWVKLKANEAYGMYADAMKKFNKTKEQVDNVTKENYDLFRSFGRLKSEFDGLSERFAKLERETKYWKKAHVVLQEQHQKLQKKHYEFDEKFRQHTAIGWEYCPHTGK